MGLQYRPVGVNVARVPLRGESSHSGPRFAAHGLTTRKRLDITRSLLLGVHSKTISQEVDCCRTAVDNVARNLRVYGCVRKPVGKLGRRRKITDEDEEALFEQLVRSGWMYQDEIVYWLDVERDVVVNRSTVARLLKKNNWTRRTLRPFSINQNEELREGYRRDMRQFTCEDLVFLDESIFNEKTGWRRAVNLIEQPDAGGVAEVLERYSSPAALCRMPETNCAREDLVLSAL